MRIGQRDGADEYTLGRVLAIAARGDGPVFVYDDQAHSLRMYDRAGSHVRNIGRLGSGPGEFRYILGLAMLRDGRLAAWDVRGQRINLYAPNGDRAAELLIPLGSTQFSANAFAIDTAGYFYIRTWSNRFRMLRVNSTGVIVDTLWYPTGRLRGMRMEHLHPDLEAGFHHDGYFVWGESDRYELFARTVDGVPLRIARTVAAVPFEPGEHAQQQARVNFIDRTEPSAQGNAMPPVPFTKPFFIEIKVSRDGSIWALRQMRSRPRTGAALAPANGVPPLDWIADTEFEVFAPDGAYLGRVPVPPRAEIDIIDGDDLWGTVRDDDDIEYVVHYRLRRG